MGKNRGAKRLARYLPNYKKPEKIRLYNFYKALETNNPVKPKYNKWAYKKKLETSAKSTRNNINCNEDQDDCQINGCTTVDLWPALCTYAEQNLSTLSKKLSATVKGSFQYLCGIKQYLNESYQDLVFNIVDYTSRNIEENDADLAKNLPHQSHRLVGRTRVKAARHKKIQKI